MSGKSTLALYTAVYKPYMEYLHSGKKIDIHWLLFSLEMSAEVLFAKLLSIYLYDAYRQVISYKDILSFNERLSDEKYTLILESKPWLEELEKRCTIIDKSISASGLWAVCKDWSKNFGTYEKYIDKQGKEHDGAFTPNNPKQYLITVIDHIGLLDVPSGSTKKNEIDTASTYLIYFRNVCRFTVYIVQQLNRNFKKMERRTEGGGQYQGIQLDDFKDSSGTTDAAEIVLSIFFPEREKVTSIGKYKVSGGGLGNRARVLSVLKHRFGQSDVSDVVGFYGEIGLWRELPDPEQIDDYTNLINL